ncbi:MAG: response regulator [Gammaproteobacteria bacterium]|nr:response regulator [Gammaproteobacteria bacterium]
MDRTIAIVEDDPDQRQNCADALTRRGYRVLAYGSRAEAQAAFDQQLPDLAILDIMLGDEQDAGFELCRYLLARKSGLPIIFLTSRSDDIDRISGLRLGAWDYQTKPVSLEFLAERVSSVFRILNINQEKQQTANVQHIGDLTLDSERMQVAWQGQSLVLTFTEYSVLQELINKKDARGSSYDELADATRQGVVQNNTINTHILHLRNKFRDIDKDFDCIKSVYGFGYRWVCA